MRTTALVVLVLSVLGCSDECRPLPNAKQILWFGENPRRPGGPEDPCAKTRGAGGQPGALPPNH